MTMSALPAGCIVVGVDGSDDADRAISWAAQQAALEGRTLAVVHCTDQPSVRGASWVDAPGIDHDGLTEAMRAASRRIVTHARERAALQAPAVLVRTDVLDVDPREALLDLSATAHLVVLGSRGRGPLRSAVLGSVSASVSRHAHCPVVVCRPPDHARPPGDRIVVGADGTGASRPVLEFAYAQASLRRVPLTVMHCYWDVTATHGPRVVAPGEDTDPTDLRLLLAESAAGLAEKYPDVEVTQELARGLVDECLADRTPDAGLVVVGRAATNGWSTFVHASCALAVLERAHATVAVVPESPESPESPDERNAS